jgi:tRNA (mo5U34)-methyltransferase
MAAVIASDSRDEALSAQVAALTWYHTIELPGGILTEGEYDTRAAAARIPLPASLQGLRCLDVGTHDGFWAFEMERRGAASVDAIDLDDPRQVDFSYPAPPLSDAAMADRRERPRAFWCAHAALDSNVARHDLSVYDLSVGDVGPFDFAFIGTLLLHLREPLRALDQIRRVLAPGGRLLINDGVSLELSLMHPFRPVHTLSLLPGKPFWWLPNARGLRRYLEKAGFRIVSAGGPYLLPNGPGFARPAPARTRSPSGWLASALHQRGMPHAWALGEAP